MPIHDCGRVDAGTFHHFHHSWIEEIQRSLNSGVLPAEYFAMAEQQAGVFGPDVLTLQVNVPSSQYSVAYRESNEKFGTLRLAPPDVKLTAETDLEFYRCKQNSVVVRHVSGDRIIAVIEIISQGNKSSVVAIGALVAKATQLLLKGVHLLIMDLHAPGTRDPHGIHGVIWQDLTGQQYPKPEKSLTLASYESGPDGTSTRAYVQPVTVGDDLPDMPLFLKPGAHVLLQLAATYHRAFAALPNRWRSVLEA